MKRVGLILGMVDEKENRYRELHAAVWPDILRIIKESNIENYSIYLKDGYLFAYYEYTGDAYQADMAKMAREPLMQKWWAECMPCQRPVGSAQEGEWWAKMEEVFHLD